MITEFIPGYGWLLTQSYHGRHGDMVIVSAVFPPAPAFYRVLVGGGVLVEEVL